MCCWVESIVVDLLIRAFKAYRVCCLQPGAPFHGAEVVFAGEEVQD